MKQSSKGRDKVERVRLKRMNERHRLMAAYDMIKMQ